MNAFKYIYFIINFTTTNQIKNLLKNEKIEDASEMTRITD